MTIDRKASAMKGIGDTICSDLGISSPPSTKGRQRVGYLILGKHLRRWWQRLGVLRAMLMDRELYSYLLTLMAAVGALALIYLIGRT